ncbi:MAG: penicillin-binding protein [Pseudomonadota bacterium]|nr:penicillin-binding protein [Pseudomonadota bacterium]
MKKQPAIRYRQPSPGAAPRPRRLSPAEADANMLAETRLRGRVAFGGIAFALLAIALRSSWLMVVPDARLEERGRDQFQSAVEMRGKRGALLDRHDRILAYTVSLPALYANPAKLSKEQAAERIVAISAATGRTEAWIAGRFVATNAQGRTLQEVRLGGGLDPATARALVAGLPRDVMWLEEEPMRMYPGKDLAAPLIGYTDAKDDGAAGLEKVLQAELAGDTYRILQERDRKGRTIEAGVDEARLRRGGRSVRLTVDAAIQRATEHALDEAMLLSRPETAMAVVMDVETGAVLALATRPAGNPNDGGSRARQEDFKNRPAMDQIEPGSVMKPFIASAALEEGLVTASTIIDCELGAWSIGGRTIHDDHPKGTISVSDVIKYSSNIGSAKLGFMLGPVKVFDYLKAFGFGRSTTLGLPGEVSGQMRTAANVRTIELATTSFGQGITASPVQLAAAVATIANGGVRMTPMLVDAVLDGNGAVETQREPRTDRRVLSEDTARTITAMMESVIDEGGTGTRARVDGYRVAGKTGTAQKVENGVYSSTKRIGSFVGFLPADRPEVAIVVVIDTPTVGSKYGGIVAGPAFASIAGFTMRYLGVQPDPPQPKVVVTLGPDGEPLPPVILPALPPVDPEDALLVRAAATEVPLELVGDGQGRWILPDLHGRTLRDALTGLGPAGLDLQVAGYGRVTEQAPAPGTAVSPGEPVRIRLN